MGILKFAIIIGMLIGTIKGIQWFNRRCRRRFGYRFFTLRGFCLAAIGINCVWWGLYCYAAAARQHAPTSDGLILTGLAVIPIAWLLYENVRDTDLTHGLGGSALQLVLFFPLAIYSIPLLVIAMVLTLFAGFKAGPAWLLDE